MAKKKPKKPKCHHTNVFMSLLKNVELEVGFMGGLMGNLLYAGADIAAPLFEREMRRRSTCPSSPKAVSFGGGHC